MKGAAGPEKHLQDISSNTSKMIGVLTHILTALSSDPSGGTAVGKYIGKNILNLPQLPQ
jgi:hypothetical protein